MSFGELGLAVLWGAVMAVAFRAVKPRVNNMQLPWVLAAWLVVFFAVGAFLISG